MGEVKRLRQMNRILVGLILILTFISGYYYTRFEEVQKQLLENQKNFL